jgi:poly(3-hydroxyalkanoate) synthetase
MIEFLKINHSTMTKNSPPKHKDLPDWVHWLAQDADGTWWGYEVEPLQHHQGWYENELGRNIRLTQDPENTTWQDSLVKL